MIAIIPDNGKLQNRRETEHYIYMETFKYPMPSFDNAIKLAC